MSKSYKKVPVYKSVYKNGKRLANKAVRKSKHIGSGGNYKKAFLSYNIHEQYSYSTFQEYKNTRKRLNFKESEEEMFRNWERCYKRK